MDKLNELTIWALYCLHTSKDKKEYAHKYINIAKKKTNNFSILFDKNAGELVKGSASVAIELYKPEWTKKEKQEINHTRLINLKENLREAEFDLASIINEDGGILWQKTMEDKKKYIEKLKLEIKKVENERV